MSRTSSCRAFLAASAAVSVLVGLFACGNGTFQNELPAYDADLGEIDAATVNPADSATETDASDAHAATDASDGAAAHDGGHDGGDGGSVHDGGDASTDGHADVE